MSDPKSLLVIDGNEVDVRPGETILHAARRIGIDIPTLCHDDRLDPAAACRLCLVEVEGARLMQPACATRTSCPGCARTSTSSSPTCRGSSPASPTGCSAA